MMQNETTTALKYFEEAYLLKPEEENLLRIVDILINRMDNINDSPQNILRNFARSRAATVQNMRAFS